MALSGDYVTLRVNDVRYLETAFDSNYHSLQITAQRRFTRSSQINMAYTWAKNMTNSQNEFATAPQNTYDLKAEYARANLDRRHVFNINYVYEIPYFSDQKGFQGKLLGGWQFSGIFYYYPRAYHLEWTPESGHGMRILYGAATGAAGGDVLMAARLESGLDLSEVQLATDLLNAYNYLAGTPDYVRQDAARYRAVTAADVQRVARAYLRQPKVVLTVVPEGRRALALRAAGGSGVRVAK